MGDGHGPLSLSSLPFDLDDIDLTIMTPSELRMEMESAIEDAVETAEDILVRMQMMEPERVMGQYCQSINETATESAKTVKNGVLNIFSKILTNVLNEESGTGSDDTEMASYIGQHPLMIDLVLRNVLQYLSIPQLSACRLVCKLWNAEAGSYIRRKQRIVFSPNCIEKMATFTAFMKAQQDSKEDESSEYGGDYNDNIHHDNSHSPKNPLRNLPPYTDFSFTAQFPRINFSRSIVRDFSQTYGEYVKKLEIFFPNDSALSAKDFRQFFLRGMPHVQYIHFVNLPMKLTQGSFLRRRINNTRGTMSGGLTDDNHDNDNRGGASISDNLSSDDSINSNNCIRNNNPEKDIQNPTKLMKDIGGGLQDNPNYDHNDNLHQDCLLKWDSLTHLKIDRTLLIEVAWSKPFLEDLFSTMPSLKHYELWTWNTQGGDSHSNPYFACLTPAQRHGLVSLYPGSVGESMVMSLADYGLTHLRKLHLPVFSGEVSAQSVENLLGTLRGTLEELQVNCSSMQDSRMIHFPRMDKLKVLHMIISVPWKNVYTLFTPGIEYQSQFPQLETLKLELAVYHDFGFIHYFFPSQGSICRSLRELDISYSGYRDDKFIGIVGRIFPNLRRLRLDGYGNRILGSICAYLGELEYFEMYLIYGFNVDDQLTGLDRKVCNEIRKEGRWREVMIGEEGEGRSPSLANLRKLKTLKIKQKDYQAKFWPQAQCITDITGYFALAKISTLRHLHIESVKFSLECRQYLAQTLEDCWLDFL